MIDVAQLYRADGETVRQERLAEYERRARAGGQVANVVLTGRRPIWLYLRLAHALHGVARTLTYRARGRRRSGVRPHLALTCWRAAAGRGCVSETRRSRAKSPVSFQLS
jgi:hypothetical protein